MDFPSKRRLFQRNLHVFILILCEVRVFCFFQNFELSLFAFLPHRGIEAIFYPQGIFQFLRSIILFDLTIIMIVAIPPFYLMISINRSKQSLFLYSFLFLTVAYPSKEHIYVVSGNYFFSPQFIQRCTANHVVHNCPLLPISEILVLKILKGLQDPLICLVATLCRSIMSKFNSPKLSK